MKKYTILSPNGTVLRTGMCDEALVSLQAGSGETLVDGWVESPYQEPVLNYTAKRSMAYPPVEEQLDMLWHAMNSGEAPKVNAFFDAIKAVKTNYPKVS